MIAIDGSVALVAGGGAGIGLGIAQALAESGAQVVLADLLTDNAEAAAADLRAAGARALSVGLDVREPAHWAAAAAAAEQAFGPVDILVNSAGVGGAFRPAVDIEPDRFRRMFEISVMGVVHGVQAIVPGMRARGRGWIVNIASMAAIDPVATIADYSVTRAGVMSLTQTLAMELAGTGVGATFVCPGRVRTGMAANTSRIMGEAGRPVTQAANPATAAQASDVKEPIEVGRIIREAIARGDEAVFTHAENRPRVEARFARTLAGFDGLQRR